jgi:sodium/potassium/calcium exchanger 6
MVHQASDKCAFIQANCDDEEAGLLSYLGLYYCSLADAPYVAFGIIALWLALLFSTIGIAASDFFSINLSTISTILGMSESMAGVTFLAFGNGSPDVFSTFAAMRTHSGSLAVGELIGAAGFITAVVAGSMALVREFKVAKKSFVRDLGFFIVASSFSLVFLADGALYFWECCVMIGFYLFYVAVVVLWHWFLQRRRRRRERDALARGHHINTNNVEIEAEEENLDEEDLPPSEQQSLLQHGRDEDFDALERGGTPSFNIEEASDEGSDDDDGDAGRRLAAEMSNEMRIARRRGSRRNTLNPIRPSLVGAMEFRSVLAALQKSRTTQAWPIHLRRYSDDGTAAPASYHGLGTDTAVTSEYEGSVVVTSADGQQEGLLLPGSNAGRARAVSMNDATGSRQLNPAAFTVAQIPHISVLGATPTFPGQATVVTEDTAAVTKSTSSSPAIISSAESSRDATPDPTPGIIRQSTADRLATPIDTHQQRATDYFWSRSKHYVESPAESPKTRSPRSGSPLRPHVVIPGSRDHTREQSSPLLSPFPMYSDSPGPMTALSSRASSLHLPEAHLSRETSFIPEDTPRPIKWWPYGILPCPRLMLATLFPTLCNWSEKSIWDKFLSILSTPSIFLLTITLPVVDSEQSEEAPPPEPEHEDTPPPMMRRRSTRAAKLSSTSPRLEARMQPEWLQYRRATQDFGLGKITSPGASSGLNGHHDLAHVAVARENEHHVTHGLPTPPTTSKSPENNDDGSPRKDWNRWLLVVQIFTAPLFVMLIFWANSSNDELTLSHLVHLVLYSLVGSLVVFGILVVTTTPETPPRYRFIFCFVGFVVSVAWISTIANEVVGVLKAFGVILGISDAILGLTIFAVGNSLGDLVADITVARLGYPVMALSACFGGPMLNILLGIGVSGLYMTVKEGRHHHAKNPNDPMRFEPYKIEVSGTLMVSGITLLVTLVSLLIAVPLNKWTMSRRIGWGLIALWTVSSIVNLVVEITGVWPDQAYLTNI